jgi:hypothetical protein
MLHHESSSWRHESGIDPPTVPRPDQWGDTPAGIIIIIIISIIIIMIIMAARQRLRRPVALLWEWRCRQGRPRWRRRCRFSRCRGLGYGPRHHPGAEPVARRAVPGWWRRPRGRYRQDGRQSLSCNGGHARVPGRPGLGISTAAAMNGHRGECTSNAARSRERTLYPHFTGKDESNTHGDFSEILAKRL